MDIQSLKRVLMELKGEARDMRMKQIKKRLTLPEEKEAAPGEEPRPEDADVELAVTPPTDEDVEEEKPVLAKEAAKEDPDLQRILKKLNL